jgi:hypothetical protein
MYFYIHCRDFIGIVRLGSKEKVVSILGPLPIPTIGKNVFKIITKNLNLALQDANPTFNDDIFKWGWKVPTILTNSHGYAY